MKQNDWTESWQCHLEQYLKVPPRTGIFIHTYFPSISTALEVACGSSRDSIYLARRGIDVTASDYDKKLIDVLRKKFIYPHLTYVEANAFELPFKDNTFDMVFHNGFFIYFKSEDEICSLLHEQCRVAKKYILFFVHNSLNASLVHRFSELALQDPIYNIRFFKPFEVVDIVNRASIGSHSLSLLKFGGPFDLLYNKRIKKTIPNILYPLRETIIPRMYQIQRWKVTERIACLIELEKWRRLSYQDNQALAITYYFIRYYILYCLLI